MPCVFRPRNRSDALWRRGDFYRERARRRNQQPHAPRVAQAKGRRLQLVPHAMAVERIAVLRGSAAQILKVPLEIDQPGKRIESHFGDQIGLTVMRVHRRLPCRAGGPAARGLTRWLPARMSAQ